MNEEPTASEAQGTPNQGAPGAAEPVEPTVAAGTAETIGQNAANETIEAAEVADDETVTSRAQVEVALVRSVRHGRIIVTATAVGAVLGAVAALFFPVSEGAEYTLGQAVGQMLVVGAIIGLLLGSLLALLLGVAAKRRRGAALAIQTDVQ